MSIALLLIILVITAALPLISKKIENHLEPFLLIMGIAASLSSRAFTLSNLQEIFTNKLLYIITAAVLVIGFVFKFLEEKVSMISDFLLHHLPLKVIIFMLIIGLGFLSSVITAIVASLLLAEFLLLLPLDRKSKIRISITSCFAIGMGAVLTPIGEPLSTIVVSKLHGEFTYMINLLGIYIAFGIILMGILGAFLADGRHQDNAAGNSKPIYIPEEENAKTITMRAANIFIFIVGLDLLGIGFKPIIDTYIIHWNTTLLYLANLLSAILDNATLAAAEISPNMSESQIRAILISLLVSGGMLITGNIPNIVTAGKLKISMKEWAVFAIPVGIVLLAGFYLVLFIF